MGVQHRDGTQFLVQFLTIVLHNPLQFVEGRNPDCAALVGDTSSRGPAPNPRRLFIGEPMGQAGDETGVETITRARRVSTTWVAQEGHPAVFFRLTQRILTCPFLITLPAPFSCNNVIIAFE